MIRGRGSSATLVLLLTLSGCASQSKLHEGFDFDAFRRSPTAFGGVANLVRDSTAGFPSPEQINSLLETTFIKKRQDLRFVPTGTLRERIGEGRYSELLDRYRDGRGIDASTYGMLAEAMGAQARYLALARIESVTVTHDRTVRDPDYNLATDNNEVKKSTRRNVWVAFDLFDLTARRGIWSETWVGSASNEVTFPEKPGKGTWGTLKAIFGSEPDYPPPRAASKAVGNAFWYFAEKIPKR